MLEILFFIAFSTLFIGIVVSTLDSDDDKSGGLMQKNYVPVLIKDQKQQSRQP